MGWDETIVVVWVGFASPTLTLIDGKKLLAGQLYLKSRSFTRRPINHT